MKNRINNRIKKDLDGYYGNNNFMDVKDIRYLFNEKEDESGQEDIKYLFGKINYIHIKPQEIKSYEAKPYEVEYWEVKFDEIKSYEIDYIDIKPNEIKSYEINYIDLKPYQINYTDIKPQEIKSIITDIRGNFTKREHIDQKCS